MSCSPKAGPQNHIPECRSVQRSRGHVNECEPVGCARVSSGDNAGGRSGDGAVHTCCSQEGAPHCRRGSETAIEPMIMLVLILKLILMLMLILILIRIRVLILIIIIIIIIIVMIIVTAPSNSPFLQGRRPMRGMGFPFPSFGLLPADVIFDRPTTRWAQLNEVFLLGFRV